ncbi:MAG: hypothetical protein AAGN82_03015, partial [Myxococcota bacterium]
MPAREASSSIQPTTPSPSPAVAAAIRRAIAPPPADLTSLRPHLRPIVGAPAAYVVHDEYDPSRTLLRRLQVGDDGDVVVGPVVQLEGRTLAAAMEIDGTLWRITARGDGAAHAADALCASADDAAAGCRAGDAEAVVRLGATPALVQTRPARRPHRGPSKQRPRAAAPAGGLPEVDVVLTPLGGDDQEPRATGLRFSPPLEGMTVVAAANTPTGFEVLYFERGSPPKPRGRRTPQAALRRARLDLEGQLVPDATATLYVGPRLYGYVVDHFRPRLWVEGPRAVFTARVRPPGG